MRFALIIGSSLAPQTLNAGSLPEGSTNFAGLIIVLGVIAAAIMMAGLQRARSKK